MIFSELYNAYYNAVAEILRAAVARPLEKSEIRAIIERTAFGESVLAIEPALANERWPLLFPDGGTPLHNAPTMPLTTLQKRWLKAISLDPRMRLFGLSFPELTDVEPLFTAEDYLVFDRYADGDPYEDEGYIRRFRLILNAIRTRQPLGINLLNRRDGVTYAVLMPEYLEYSEKDDKFRLIASGSRYMTTVNLARIISCKPYKKPLDIAREKAPEEKSTVELELTDRRNALERVMLHFAHFEKEAERAEDGKYRVKITYDKNDETELVIRVLSFGPMLRAVSPESFVGLIKKRLIEQKNCER